jgi:hypothetical protein
VQIVTIFPNGSFKSTIEFIEKYLLEYLTEYQQFGFVKQLQELKVGTRPAGKAYRTRIILFSATNISSISQLIDVLEEERQIRQLHLLLLSEDTSRPSYDTELEQEEERKPAKGKKPVVKKGNGKGNKRIKQEVKEEESITKVYRTIIQAYKY